MAAHSAPLDTNLAANFDPRSGSWLERLFFNHRGAVVAICALVTVILGWQAGNLRLQADFEKMIPTRHPFIETYFKHKDQLKGSGNVLRVAVVNRNGSILDAHYLQTLQKINDEIYQIPGVDRLFVKSLWTPATRWLAVTEEGLEGGPVMPDNFDGSTETLQTLKTNIERSGEIGRLVAADFQSSIVLVPLLDRYADGTPLDYGAFSEAVEKVRRKYESDTIAIHITGFSKVVGDLIEGLQQVFIFFAMAIAIAAIVLYSYTRCVRSTALVVTCSVVAVIWLAGLLPLLGYQLDPYSILVPFLVFAIGMSHGAQKMNGIMQDIGRGIPRLIAARFTFRRLFMAGLTALLADAVGFAALMVIDIQVIRDLAVTASIGVVILIFTNLVLLPVLLSYLGVSAEAARRSLLSETATEASGGEKHPLWRTLDLFTTRRWAIAAVLVALVMAGGGFLVSMNLKIGDLDAGAPELRPDSRYNQDNAFITSHYAASSDVLVAVVETPEYKCIDYKTLMTVDALQWELMQVAGVEGTYSYADLTKQVMAGLNEGVLKWFDLRPNQDAINEVTTNASRELFSQTCDTLVNFVYLADHKATTLTRIVDKIEAFARQNNSDALQIKLGAGNGGIEAATNIVVKQANLQMLGLVYLAVIALCFITFRSVPAVACAVLPLLLTSILCEALMVTLNMGVKVATLPVIALGVGIGVDYALYILSVTMAELRRGATLSEAYYRALTFTGRVVVLTGITLAIGVATWAASPIKFQADMGILLAFMFLWNMLGALVLLPALGHFMLNRCAARTPSVEAGLE